MNKMPVQLREMLADDPYYKVCARKSGECKGRVQFHHALVAGGRQVQEWWAIVPICHHHHLGEGFDSQIMQWMALSRAPLWEFKKYPKAEKRWLLQLAYLMTKYGIYNPKDQGTIYRLAHESPDPEILFPKETS